MERCELPQIHRINVGAVLDEQLGHLEVSVAAGVVQRHQPALVLGVHVRAVLEQQLHDPRPVVARGQVQRRGLAAVAGVAVYVERREEGEQLLLVAAPGRLQQLVLLVVRAGEDWASQRIRHIQRRLPFRVAQCRVRAVLQQHHANVVFPLDGC